MGLEPRDDGALPGHVVEHNLNIYWGVFWPETDAITANHHRTSDWVGELFL
jgi:hypothetical protein